MALLTVTAITAAGVSTNLTAATASDTISINDIAARGVVLEVLNGGGGSITVTISDPGVTPATNAGTAQTVTVAPAGRKRIFVGPANVNQATGVATITYSGITSVTAEAFRY